MSTTLALAAKQLRAIADAIDAADETAMNVYVSFAPDYSVKKATKVAAVDAVAGRLGMVAKPTKSGTLWYHEATDIRDGVDLTVHAHIDPPPKRCACGAECTHAASDGA